MDNVEQTIDKREFCIDGFKEKFIREKLSKMSIAERNDFFEYAIAYFDGFDKTLDVRQNVRLKFNRFASCGFFYSYDIVFNDEGFSPQKWMKSISDKYKAVNAEFRFFQEKAALLFYLEKGKRKRKRILAKWFKYDKRFGLIREIYSHDNAFGRSDVCKSIYRRAAKHMREWKAFVRQV